MRARALLLLLAAFVACGRDGGLYRHPSGLFSVRPPDGWRIQESVSEPGVSFFGPPAGASPFSQSVAVYFHGPESAYAGPDAYAASRAALSLRATEPRSLEVNGAPAKELVAVRKGLGLHSSAPPANVRERIVLLPGSGGFFAVVHTSPEAAEDDEAALRTVLESLRPRR